MPELNLSFIIKVLLALTFGLSIALGTIYLAITLSPDPAVRIGIAAIGALLGTGVIILWYKISTRD